MRAGIAAGAFLALVGLGLLIMAGGRALIPHETSPGVSSVASPDGPETAPRLAQTRPEPDLLRSYYDQLRDALTTLARAGLVHGDLSPYNILAAGERLVIIDLPQIVDLVGNAAGFDFLLRDCTNVCTWFRSRGLEVDGDELFAELLAYAF